MSNLQGRKRVHGEQYEKNGTCAFCDFPTEKYICFSTECVRAYNRERQAARRQALYDAGLTPTGTPRKEKPHR